MKDGLHFTAAFEIVGGYNNPDPKKLAPYIVEKNPTIGIGLDLVTGVREKAVRDALAADVRAYYLTHYRMDLSKESDTQIIDMLKNQAWHGVAKQALTVQDAQSLYQQTYRLAENRAIRFIGQTAWNNISAAARIALTDIAFNGIGGFKALRRDLQAPVVDYVLAGFDMLDSLRSQGNIGHDRSLADYEYMLYGFIDKLGNLL